MMAVNEFRAGPTSVLRFMPTGGGTIQVQEQYRKFTLKSKQAVLDASAGSVDWREFIAGLKEYTGSVEVLHNGTATPMGTADIKSLRASSGTWDYSPFGTATGSRKYSGSYIGTSMDDDFPFDDLATIAFDFQGNGALVEGLW